MSQYIYDLLRYGTETEEEKRSKKEKFIRRLRKLEKSSIVNGKEKMTLWGAAVLIAQKRGLKGSDALDKATHVHFDEIKDAIINEKLTAISKNSYKATSKYLDREDILFSSDKDFHNWLAEVYPTINDALQDGHQEQQERTSIAIPDFTGQSKAPADRVIEGLSTYLKKQYEVLPCGNGALLRELLIEQFGNYENINIATINSLVELGGIPSERIPDRKSIKKYVDHCFPERQ